MGTACVAAIVLEIEVRREKESERATREKAGLKYKVDQKAGKLEDEEKTVDDEEEKEHLYGVSETK